MITRVVKMYFAPEFTEEFKMLFTNVKPYTANFPGCLNVKLLQDETENQLFFTLSTWENAPALENYGQSDLFKGTWALVKPHFMQKPQAWSLIET